MQVQCKTTEHVLHVGSPIIVPANFSIPLLEIPSLYWKVNRVVAPLREDGAEKISLKQSGMQSIVQHE